MMYTLSCCQVPVGHHDKSNRDRSLSAKIPLKMLLFKFEFVKAHKTDKGATVFMYFLLAGLANHFSVGGN